MNRLLFESNGELNDAPFRAGLVDERHLTVCLRIFGSHAASTIANGLGSLKLTKAAQLQLRSARRVGDKMILIYRVARGRR